MKYNEKSLTDFAHKGVFWRAFGVPRETQLVPWLVQKSSFRVLWVSLFWTKKCCQKPGKLWNLASLIRTRKTMVFSISHSKKHEKMQSENECFWAYFGGLVASFCGHFSSFFFPFWVSGGGEVCGAHSLLFFALSSADGGVLYWKY